MSTNDFSPETRRLFQAPDGEYAVCFGCGRNKADCGHHIFGRSGPGGCAASPLNFAPLCNHDCHLPRHGYWTSDAGRRELLQKSWQKLWENGYRLQEKDHAFLDWYGTEITRLNIQL